MWGQTKLFATANWSESAKEFRLNSKPAVGALKKIPSAHKRYFSVPLPGLKCRVKPRTWFVTLGQKAVLLCQSCVFSHAVEDSSLWYEVWRSVKLCYLSLVQHQHSARRDRREGGYFSEQCKKKKKIEKSKIHLHTHIKLNSDFLLKCCLSVEVMAFYYSDMTGLETASMVAQYLAPGVREGAVSQL